MGGGSDSEYDNLSFDPRFANADSKTKIAYIQRDFTQEQKDSWNRYDRLSKRFFYGACTFLAVEATITGLSFYQAHSYKHEPIIMEHKLVISELDKYNSQLNDKTLYGLQFPAASNGLKEGLTNRLTALDKDNKAGIQDIVEVLEEDAISIKASPEYQAIENRYDKIKKDIAVGILSTMTLSILGLISGSGYSKKRNAIKSTKLRGGGC